MAETSAAALRRGNKLKKEKLKAYFTEGQYATDNSVGCAIIGLNKMNNF